MLKVTGRAKKRGFTLMELLVAIVIMGILSVCIFLVTTAAGDTFLRQRELLSADDVKDFVLTYAKQAVSTAEHVSLSNVLGDKEAGTVSTLLKQYNVLFSYDTTVTTDSGTKNVKRIFTLDREVDGLLYPDPSQQPTGEVLPVPTNAVPLLTENIYDKYSVRLQFSTVKNSKLDRCVTLKIIVSVYEATDTAGVYEVKSTGSELVQLLNLERLGNEVQQSGVEGDVYDYCYFYST